VDLLDKLNEYLRDQPVTQSVKELRGKVEERVRQLTEVLVFELGWFDLGWLGWWKQLELGWL
jgi:hypothetical protein